MEKYIEFGIGNTWLLRTEFQKSDGTEYEVKGISGKINFISFYLRIWLGKKVWIIDSKEGFKGTTKTRHDFKLILGIHSYF